MKPTIKCKKRHVKRENGGFTTHTGSHRFEFVAHRGLGLGIDDDPRLVSLESGVPLLGNGVRFGRFGIVFFDKGACASQKVRKIPPAAGIKR